MNQSGHGAERRCSKPRRRWQPSPLGLQGCRVPVLKPAQLHHSDSRIASPPGRATRRAAAVRAGDVRRDCLKAKPGLEVSPPSPEASRRPPTPPSATACKPGAGVQASPRGKSSKGGPGGLTGAKSTAPCELLCSVGQPPPPSGSAACLWNRLMTDYGSLTHPAPPRHDISITPPFLF